MLSMIIAAALAGDAPATTIRIVGKVDRQVLVDALAAPERPRVAGEKPRYCVVDDVTRNGGGRRVCRSRQEWVSLGVNPLG